MRYSHYMHFALYFPILEKGLSPINIFCLLSVILEERQELTEIHQPLHLRLLLWTCTVHIWHLPFYVFLKNTGSSWKYFICIKGAICVKWSRVLLHFWMHKKTCLWCMLSQIIEKGEKEVSRTKGTYLWLPLELQTRVMHLCIRHAK